VQSLNAVSHDNQNAQENAPDQGNVKTPSPWRVGFKNDGVGVKTPTAQGRGL
jgi:hypothetical protein